MSTRPAWPLSPARACPVGGEHAADLCPRRLRDLGRVDGDVARLDGDGQRVAVDVGDGAGLAGIFSRRGAGRRPRPRRPWSPRPCIWIEPAGEDRQDEGHADQAEVDPPARVSPSLRISGGLGGAGGPAGPPRGGPFLSPPGGRARPARVRTCRRGNGEAARRPPGHAAARPFGPVTRNTCPGTRASSSGEAPGTRPTETVRASTSPGARPRMPSSAGPSERADRRSSCHGCSSPTGPSERAPPELRPRMPSPAGPSERAPLGAPAPGGVGGGASAVAGAGAGRSAGHRPVGPGHASALVVPGTATDPRPPSCRNRARERPRRALASRPGRTGHGGRSSAARAYATARAPSLLRGASPCPARPATGGPLSRPRAAFRPAGPSGAGSRVTARARSPSGPAAARAVGDRPAQGRPRGLSEGSARGRRTGAVVRAEGRGRGVRVFRGSSGGPSGAPVGPPPPNGRSHPARPARPGPPGVRRAAPGRPEPAPPRPGP